MEGTRNNKGVKHENGSVESSHRHLKTRLDQSLMIRGSRNFDSLDDYRELVNDQVSRHNARIQHLVKEERKYLNSLPKHKTRDFDVEFVRVASTSVVVIRQVRYSVPSRLIGMQLKAHVYDDRIECFLGSTQVLNFERLRWNKGARLRSINYRHLIEWLVRKPQAFRNYVFRDDLFPCEAFRMAWESLNDQLNGRDACREIVTILKLAVNHDEERISNRLMELMEAKTLPTASEIEKLFPTSKTEVKVEVESGDLTSYNQLLLTP